MPYYMFEDQGGVQVLSSSAPQPHWSLIPEDSVDAVFSAIADDKPFRVVDGALQVGPAPPGPNLAWDWSAGEWREARSLQAAQAEKRYAIDTERDRLCVEPIQYGGRRLDADPRAQKNISDKLLEIAGREALGEDMPAPLLAWRDADNLMQAFASMQDMKAWLLGLTVAIAQRGSEAYAWSWQAKASADAAQTLEQLGAVAW